MKLAIITGASAGIGRQTAAQFITDNFHVVNISRRDCDIAGVENLQCDLAESAAFEKIAPRLHELLDQASEVCLVHNACRMDKDRVDSCDPSTFNQILQVNLIGPTRLNQHVIPRLSAGSSVIYIGSTLSEKAVQNSYSYVTSKHATVGMMRATCQDLIGRGIHTCCVCPGFTDTDMLRTHLGNDPAVMEFIAGLNAFNRMIEPDEIARLIHFCHHNPVINGSIMHAHLGQKES